MTNKREDGLKRLDTRLEENANYEFLSKRESSLIYLILSILTNFDKTIQ